MTDERNSGIALICGSHGGILTMAIHPTAGGPLTPAQFESVALVSAIAHTLAMVSILALFLGALGLTRSLAAREAASKPDRLAICAFATYGFACVAILIATAISGFIIPEIIRHMISDAANKSQWQIAIDAVFQFNQAFSRIYSVATSVAIALWSISALRNGGLRRFVAIYGCVLALALIGVLTVYHLRLDVHGMAVVILFQAVWFIFAGVHSMRKQPSVTVA